MKATVICFDTDVVKGEANVHHLNESCGAQRAHFYKYDASRREKLREVIEKINKEVGDVSIILNCASTYIAASYYDVMTPKMEFVHYAHNLIFSLYEGIQGALPSYERKQKRHARFHSHSCN